LWLAAFPARRLAILVNLIYLINSLVKKTAINIRANSTHYYNASFFLLSIPIYMPKIVEIG